MLQYLSIGTLLGLSAGFAPGPLLTLVIAETLQHDVRAGLKVALAPVITDLPIIILTFLVLTRLAQANAVLGVVSMVGGVVVFIMGYHCWRVKPIEVDLQTTKPKSLLKGILTNTLSPHPYLFWMSVGGPTIAKAMPRGVWAPLLFIAAFYVSLLGSKMLLAVLVGKSKAFLNGTVYRLIMGVLGLGLAGLAVVLLMDGLKLLGVLA